MARDYCTLSDVQGRMPDVIWTSTYDALLSALITAASRAIDHLFKRKPGAFYVDADVTRYFNGSGTTKLLIDEMAAVPTSVSVAEGGVVDNAAGTGGIYTTWTASDYYCWPYNALDEGKPFTRLDIDLYNGTKAVWYQFPRAVKIVGRFGFSTAPPPDVVQATIVQVVRWFKRGQQAYQDVGAVAELGQLQYVKQLDPDIAVLINSPLSRVTV